MATVDIIELIKPETGEKFYPATALAAVRGSDLLPRLGSTVQSTLPLTIYQLVDSSNMQFYPQTHAEAVIGLSQMIEDNQFFVKESNGNGGFRIKLKDDYEGLYANGWIADGGIGSGGGGGGGGSSTLYGLNDVSIPQPPSAPSVDDILSYSTSLGKWTNVAKATFLSGYAEQSWVQSWVQQQGYLLPSALTPYVLSSSLATVATTGNYSDLNGLPTLPSAPGTLVTNNTTAQTVSSGESLSGTIYLHKIAKTGNYGDLLNRPTNVSSFNNDAGYLTSSALDGYVNAISTGNGNYITGVSKSGKTLTFTYGTLPTTIALSNVTGADDLKAIEALTGTSGLLKKTAENTWALDTNSYLPFVGWLGGSDNLNNCTFGSWVYSSSPSNYPGSVGGGQLLALGTDASGYGKAQMAINTSGVPYFRIAWTSWTAWLEALVSGVDQTISGAKTFSNDMTLRGTLTLSGSTKKIVFGSFYIELQDIGSGNYALHTNAPFYSDQWIADGGIGSGSGGGGLITAVKSINDLGTAIATESLTETFSAKAIESIYEAVQGKQPLIDASHKLSYTLLTDTPTIPTVPTNVSAFTNDAGYITSSALSDYVPTTRKVNNHPLSTDVTVTASDVGLGNVTNLAASGYFTAFEMGTGTDANKTKITVGGTTKSLTIGYATNAGTLDGTAKGSLFSALTNDNNQISVTIGGTNKKLTVDYAGTAGSASRLSGNTAYSIWGVEYWASGVPKSVTAQPTLYIGKTRVKTSDSSNDTLMGIDGFTYAASASASNDSSKVYWDANAGGTGIGAWHFKGNIVADGWIADGGIGSSSSGGVDLARVWESLTNNTDEPNVKINIAHIPDITTSKVSDIETWIAGKGFLTSASLSGYATETWVGQQGYLTASALSGYATETWVGQQGFITGGYIGKTALQASSANQDLTGIKQVVFASTNSPSNNSLSFAQDGLYNRPRWTYADQSTYPATSVSKFLAYKDEIPSIYALTLSAGIFQAGTYNPKTAAGSFNIPTTLDHIADGTNRKYSDFVHITGAETISGAKTFSGGITMSSANIVPSADGANKIGNTGARFSEGHFSDIYAGYFKFQTSNETNVGQIYFDSDCGDFIVLTQSGQDNARNFAFYRDKFFVRQNGRLSAVVGLGSKDHRWKTICGIDGDFNGAITFRQPIDESTTGTVIGTITGSAGYMDFTAGTGGSAKHIYFHNSYGFYPSQSGVALGGGSSAATRWSTIYGVDGNLSGNLSLAQTSQITLGPVTITYDATNKALHISGTDNGQTIGIYCDGWIADGGIQQTS